MATGTIENQDRLITFFKAQKTSTNSVAYCVPFNKGVLKAWGTWGSAKVSIYIGTPLGSSTFIQLTDDALTPISLDDNAAIVIDNIVYNEKMYIKISDATGTTDLNVTLQRI